MRGEMQDGRSRPWRAWLIGGGAAGVAAVVALVLVLQSPPPAPSEPPAQAPVASQPGPAPEPLPTPQGPVSASRAPASAVPLSVDRERALKPKDTFSECANCPEMMVVPAGSFTMGSPSGEEGRRNDESPQHRVTFDRPFAVGKFAVTFDEWDACAADGGCGGYRPADQGWGRGRRLAINVSWDDAKSYVVWLSKKTGKSYRLLTEAEYEYATRAGTETAYPWGAEIGKGNANCNGCGSQWDGNQTAPVGSFDPNRFGLYDMVGTSGSGSRTVSIRVTAMRPRMALHGQSAIAQCVSSAAVPGICGIPKSGGESAITVTPRSARSITDDRNEKRGRWTRSPRSAPPRDSSSHFIIHSLPSPSSGPTKFCGPRSIDKCIKIV
jgi:hypothetical protein